MSPKSSSPSSDDTFSKSFDVPSNDSTKGLTDGLQERRRRIHNRITKHFKKKVSNCVFNNHQPAIKRSDIKMKRPNINKIESKSLENEVYRLYQVLEDLEMELKIANSKIKSYFVGLGVRIRNARRELRHTMENAKTPAVLALCNSEVSPNVAERSSETPTKKRKRKNEDNVTSTSKRFVRFSSATTQEPPKNDDETKKEENNQDNDNITTFVKNNNDSQDHGDDEAVDSGSGSHPISRLKSCMKRNHHNHDRHSNKTFKTKNHLGSSSSLKQYYRSSSKPSCRKKNSKNFPVPSKKLQDVAKDKNVVV